MSQTNTSLELILAGCRKQDRKSQEALYRMLAAKLFAVCKRYTDSAADAEDVLQEGFMAIFQKMHQYTGQGVFEGWAHRVVVNLAISKYRECKKRPALCEFDLTLHNTISCVNDDAEVVQLLSLINRLPSGLRIPFNLYAIEGYSHREIGSMLGITEIQSRTSTCRARTQLRQYILQQEQASLKTA